ncbi:DUF2272 domain-containing protein [Chitinophaga silvisoli]|uniref:DUF2272 domain-containing protein n=1 Tax=Chitinophaga silvisoli TaxID=2291814 RepID=A0A3E1NN32_9BACT|nr:DUF2272 domain-containing protein [Chitinophaga silvisoli]RFM29332.1 DUF2272 domain-containing protein [Chitinophaga silvisoli]
MITDYVKKLVDLTNNQYEQFHFESEDDQPLSQQIKEYWQNLGLDFPGTETPWSAVFVSYCVKSAGATKQEFLFAPSHSRFVHFAIQNTVNNTGVFRGFDIADVTPELGDIIQNNRGGNKYDFTYAQKHKDYPSHSAIVVEKGTDANGHYVMTIGGNESDSIRKKKVRLNDGMKIIQRSSSPYISVIRDLK